MQTTAARAPEAGRIPPSTYRTISSLLDQGLSLRVVQARVGCPFRWVRRVHAARQVEKPAQVSTVVDLADESVGTVDFVALNQAVLRDLVAIHGHPANCPSLRNVRESAFERRPFRPFPDVDVTALVCGDPPPGRSALAARR
ncbi:hypothetical protein [Microvirga solisilvae]|uniref:hypothetical protein n=1 Tax=Microvirga solisilvae TaxID=2919498 RepID=UPI001FAF288A|nr:hypothetical protein [Microvirga solisilvae]